MNRWQYAGAPDAHAGQEPQLAKLTPTRSPGATLVTPSPTSTTTPAPSCPSTPGSGKGSVPSRVARSVWQMPTALIRTRTSPGLGASRLTFSRPKSPPTSRRTAAVTSIRILLRYRPTLAQDLRQWAWLTGCDFTDSQTRSSGMPQSLAVQFHCLLP